MKINLVHLYPDLLNIYGDQGNIQTLIYRCQKRNINITLKNIRPQDPLPLGSFDLLFAGGGQDQQQLIVEKDLQTRKTVLAKAALNRIPMLTICGSYQLFGQYFNTFDNQKIKGIGIFDAYTIASKKRKIGNIIIKTNLPFKTKTIVGFENHSGNTFLQTPTKPLGQVIKGFGNNGQDKTEGAIKNNIFGCYLHGPVLPKNPELADHLIKLALENKHSGVKLKPLDDQLENLTHQQLIKKQTIFGKIYTT